MARPRGTTTLCQMVADALKHVDKLADAVPYDFARPEEDLEAAKERIEHFAETINCRVEIDKRGVYHGIGED